MKKSATQKSESKGNVRKIRHTKRQEDRVFYEASSDSTSDFRIASYGRFTRPTGFYRRGYKSPSE